MQQRTFKQFNNRFLDEDYTSTKKLFLDQGATPDEIDVAFAFHKKYKNEFDPILKNIDTQQNWTTFKTAIQDIKLLKDKKQEFKHTREQLVLRDDSEWLIVVPLDHGTSCFHGSDTDWCTTKQDKDHFSQYFYDAKVILVYCIKKNASKDKWAIALHMDRLPNTEFFTKTDESIGRQKFERLTGLSFNDIVIDIKKNIDYINQKRQSSADKDVFALIKRAAITGPDPAVEAQIIAQKSSRAAYLYAQEVMDGRFAKGEDLIAQETELSYNYARYVIEDRFEKGEDAIAKNDILSLEYAQYVLGGRFAKGEDVIAKNMQSSFIYAQRILKGRFEKGEDVIAKDLWYTTEYVFDITKSRFVKGEDIIATSPFDSYDYARRILKGRFEKGEDAIADSSFAIDYAKFINDPDPTTWAKRHLRNKHKN